jgi:peroxiredoxin Q/BCP
MTNEIKIGDKIPEFSTKSYDGIEIDNEDLLGSPFVLYFYSKDDTPGCTSQACSFRDKMDMFYELDTTVIGVSPDNAESHAKFIQKHNLNFLLLCDENRDVARKFGVIPEGDKKGTVRSTFIVDAAGIVRWMEKPVIVEGHAERVLEEVKSIAK